MKMKQILIITIVLSLIFINFQYSFAKEFKIVTTFSDYAAIAKEIVGEKATVDYLSYGDQDPHFVPPKPSLALKLRKADIFVTTGLDLELWVPTLLDKARNKEIMDGANGYVTASPGIDILEKPKVINRTEGDIHVLGNPHIQTSALNWKAISENILIGLIKNDPANADYYKTRQKEFVDRVDRALFGNELTDLFGGERLSNMLLAGTLFDFMEKEYQGQKLIKKLGGWLKEALPFRGKKIIAYHKNWAYFGRDYGLEVVDFIEPKPGIPPSAKHVKKVVQKIKEQNIELMLVASYFEKNSPKMIEQRTGIKAVILPLSVGGVPEATDNFTTMDYWIEQVKKGFGMELSPQFKQQRHQRGQAASINK